MAKGKVPGYCLHRRSGQGVARIAGKDYSFGPYEAPESQANYHKLIQEWIASGKSTSFGVNSSELTMSVIALDFLRDAEKYCEQSEYNNLLRAMSRDSGLSSAGTRFTLPAVLLQS